ncbi:hypothetical protein AC1031_000936 [Aphanomyces cochlioides]|nr:hypothetical protein AC1031_000936 [Aphanomyces cochlioides]
MSSGVSALDALEREYEAVLRQKPILPVNLDAVRQRPALDGADGEEGQEFDEMQSICSYAATCDDELEREHENEEDDEDGEDYEYEPLQNDDEDDWDKEVNEIAAADPPVIVKPIDLSDNDKDAIKRAMQEITLPAPSWGKNVTDDQLVEMVQEATISTVKDEPMEP